MLFQHEINSGIPASLRAKVNNAKLAINPSRFTLASLLSKVQIADLCIIHYASVLRWKATLTIAMNYPVRDSSCEIFYKKDYNTRTFRSVDLLNSFSDF